jgi:hypothetical protein
MKTLALTVAAFGLSVATAYVVAQTANPQASPPTTTSPPITTPPNTTPPPADTLGNQGTQGMQDRTTRSGTMGNRLDQGMAGSQGMHTPFDKLDSAHRGYITKDGVGNDRWLAQHFATCDGNSDGQLTRTEYSGCTTSTLRKSGTR